MNPAPSMSREDIAKLEIGVTTISRAAARALSVLFLAAIGTVPLVQVLVGDPSLPFRGLPGDLAAAWRGATGSMFSRILAANRALLREINNVEHQADERSWLTAAAGPRAQWALLYGLGAGNEKVYPGRDGWIFYRPEIDLLAGPGFLDPRVMRRRALNASEWTALPQPDPLPAILDFHRQLAARGVELVLMPVPAKPAIHPERFVRRAVSGSRPLQNVSEPVLFERLRQAGIRMFDAAPILLASSPSYLATDTHWRPEAMERVAEALARELAPRLEGTSRLSLRRTTETVTNRGDLARMLTLPEGTEPAPEQATIHPVFTERNEVWRSSDRAEVLVLGDSFCNIYSLPGLGWGAGAGLAEQLSYYLGAPVDRLARNDSGASATRRMLSHELARGRDRLAGKKIVVWEFAAREWAQGDWALMDLTPGEYAPARLLQPPPGAEWIVTGLVASVSTAPRPGSAPYRDHLLTALLTDLSGAPGTPDGEGAALVHAWSMSDNALQPAAHWRSGQSVRVRLRAWSDMADRLEAINRSELDDPLLRLEEPCWAEPLEESP